jgi:hypothetical protein
MITGFNTDVKHEGNVYHVQTEARGRDNPVLESLVYIGGTIIAKKMTPYADQLRQGATEDAIALLLKRQHQVMIAAIRAGRIEDLVRHSEEKAEEAVNRTVAERVPPSAPQIPTTSRTVPPRQPSPSEQTRTEGPSVPASQMKTPEVTQPSRSTQPKSVSSKTPASITATGGLNLDEVISDYLKRSSEQGRLDLKVLTPTSFIAGRNITLRVQVSYDKSVEGGAIVTIKIIGTAFKPQVYLGRTAGDGVVSFNLGLPAFTAGTAAIVIEAQSNHGRGELKHLIRRA